MLVRIAKPTELTITPRRKIRLVSDFLIRTGDLVFLTGPTGAGKTLFARRVLLRRAGAQKIAMIYQEPTSFSDPYTSVRDQMKQADKTKTEQQVDAFLLDELNLDKADIKPGCFANRLSVGKQQRLLIGVQLWRKLDLLVADEPTSALDPVNRAQVIKLLAGHLFTEKNPKALLIITHDPLVVELTRQVWQELIRRGGHTSPPLPGGAFPALFYRLDYDPAQQSQTATLRKSDIEEILAPPPNKNQASGPSSHSELWRPCPEYIRLLCRDPGPADRKAGLEEAMHLLTTRMEEKRVSSLWDLGELSRAGQPSKSPRSSRMEPWPPDREALHLDFKFFYGMPEQSPGIDLTAPSPIVLKPGQMAGLIGESGIGKTTLMRLAAGLLQEGGLWQGLRRKFLPGRHARGNRKPLWRRLQIVFQNPESTTLNPTQTIQELIEGLFGKGQFLQVSRRCFLFMERLGLQEDMLTRKASDLSGGEKYRFGLLLALLNEPTFLILDEPFATVDEETQQRIVRICFDLKNGSLRDKQYVYRAGAPMGILIISHQVEILFKICDQWYLLDRLEGKPYSRCVWSGRPISAYQQLKALAGRSSFIAPLLDVVFTPHSGRMSEPQRPKHDL